MLSLAPRHHATLLALARVRVDMRVAGDVVGHEFHGNQWTAGASISRESDDRGTIYTVALKDGKGGLEMRRGGVAPKGFLLVENAYVDDSIKGRGAGFKLYEAALRKAKSEGQEGLAAEHGTQSDDARKFWASMRRHGAKIEEVSHGGGKFSLLRTLGDLPGHEYHGNQYTPGGGAGKASRIANDQSQRAVKSGLRLDHVLAAVAHGAAAEMHGASAVSKEHTRRAEWHRGQGRLKALGDVEGHEFHGNQWTSGGSSGFPKDDDIRRENMSGIPNERADELGTRFIERLQSQADEGGMSGEIAQKQLDGMNRYQRDGYLDMNAVLRQNPDALDADEEDMGSLTLDMKSFQEMIDESPSLKESVLTYRGVQMTPELQRDLIPGAEVTLNGFQSTSFDPGVAYSFATDQGYNSSIGTTVFEIRANQGMSFGDHSLVGETEFVIGHGLNYKVRSVGEKRIATRLGPKTVRLIQLEMKSAVGKK